MSNDQVVAQLMALADEFARATSERDRFLDSDVGAVSREDDPDDVRLRLEQAIRAALAG